jgi:hypothetical protein
VEQEDAKLIPAGGGEPHRRSIAHFRNQIVVCRKWFIDRQIARFSLPEEMRDDDFRRRYCKK